jgi:hypothetical protein
MPRAARKVNLLSHCPGRIFRVIRQLSEGMPFGQQPTDLLRDDEGFDAEELCGFLAGLGIEEIKTADRGPWQNPLVDWSSGILLKDPNLNTGIEGWR